MLFVLFYNFAMRLGFPTVIVTYLALAAVHALTTPTPDLSAGVRALSVLAGLGAVVISYRTLTVALPDCQLMALAASAFMAVLPGHVAAMSVAPWLALAELIGAVLLFIAVRAVTRTAAAHAGLGEARAPLAVAAAGAVGLGVLAAALRWTGIAAAGADLPAAAEAPLAAAATGVGGWFATFWLPENWAALPELTWLAAVFAVGTLVAMGGAGLYWRQMAANQAGLTVPETAAFKVFYLVAGLGLLAGLADLVLAASPRGTVMYPTLASLALVGIVGFESWFPDIVRPLVVFAVLVFLLMVNVVGLLTLA